VGIDRGTLLLADISGYTKYLTGVELDHSQDILADLLGVVVGHLQGSLHLAKLEGDAVFCFGPDGEAADGAALVTLAEGCFFAFQEKLRNIKNLTTCPCDACLRIPDLTLKFLVHHGEYVIHDVLGNRELVGTDVILAHRLLKNEVTEQTGLRGYALFTKACIERFGIDPSATGMTEHTESYDDVGEVPGYLLDLEARWREEKERRVIRVEAMDALIDLTGELPAPPEVVWEWLTSPSKRQLWQPGVVRVDQDNPRGVPGVGTTNHCVHGDDNGLRADPGLEAVRLLHEPKPWFVRIRPVHVSAGAMRRGRDPHDGPDGAGDRRGPRGVRARGGTVHRDDARDVRRHRAVFERAGPEPLA
jgi:hypothetical protein